jgi:hypothetical protein
MVTAAARHLVAKGFQEVKADLPGFQQPDKIVWSGSGRGHIPDVTGWGSEFNLFEVETADSINDQHTADQWKLFAAFAGQHGAVFWVVVPVGAAAAAGQRLKDLGISAKVWEL